MKNLIVTEAFLTYQRGDQIADPKLVAEFSTGEHRNKVMAINAPDPAPATK